MGGTGRVGNGSPSSSQKDDGLFWSYPHRPSDYKVPYIDAKSGVQKRIDSLGAQVVELTKLVEELQKGGKDKEVDLSVQTELSLKEDSGDT